LLSSQTTFSPVENPYFNLKEWKPLIWWKEKILTVRWRFGLREKVYRERSSSGNPKVWSHDGFPMGMSQEVVYFWSIRGQFNEIWSIESLDASPISPWGSRRSKIFGRGHKKGPGWGDYDAENLRTRMIIYLSMCMLMGL